MADNVPEGSAPTKRTPEPASDAKKHASKLVVLSSVAKVPPLEESESLLGGPALSPAPGGQQPPPLPRKPGPADEGLIRPVGWTIRPGGTTTIIKLPPKTGVLPRLTSLSTAGSKPDSAGSAPPPALHSPPPALHTVPPPLPVKVEEPAEGEEETKRLPPIKLHPPTLKAHPEGESIFPSPENKAPEVRPPPLSVTRPKAVPPPLPIQPLAAKPLAVNRENAPVSNGPSGSSSLGKTTTVLLSKSARAPNAPPSLQVTSLLSPAPAIPPALPSAPVAPLSPPRETIVPRVSDLEPPVEVPEKSRPPFLVFPPAGQKGPEIIEAKPTPAQSAKLTPIVPEPTELDHPPKLLSVTGPLIASLPSSVTSPAPPEFKKMRLPPRINPGERAAAKASVSAQTVAKPASVVTPPKSFPGTAPTIPILPAGAPVTAAPPTSHPADVPVVDKGAAPQPKREASSRKPAAGGPDSAAISQANRAARVRKRRIIGIVAFYLLFAAVVPCLYFAALYFSQETRVEGQVIPPSGMVLNKEVWIVTDFRDLASGIANDLAGDRSMVMEEMQEKLSHVQRAQADVAARESRIRLLKEQIQAANDEQLALVKQAREASQHVWDGPGAQLEDDYKAHLTALDQAITDRARSLKIQYQPDPNFYSPEVWSNAFRLGLYQVPAGVDSVKERLWLEQQMKGWHDYTKAMDDKQNALREQAVQLKMAPAPKIADLKTQIDDLQQRIDGTIAEEEPLKAELEQAQTDLSLVQAREAALDAKPYEKLYALPESNITKRLPLQANGRFSWRELEKDTKYAEDEKSHAYWIFACATRTDGRQYWALHRFTVDKNSTVLLMVEPDSFISTKAILRPDLSPDEQAQ